MGSGSKELRNFIRQSLLQGHSFSRIKERLLQRGYSPTITEGIILSYKHRGRILKWLTFSLLSMMLIASLYLSGTGIVGMVTVHYMKSYTDTLSLVTDKASHYTWYPSVQGKILSVAVTGNVIGEGTAKIFLRDNEKRYLIFDSTKKNYRLSDASSSVLGKKVLHFDVLCEETCLLQNSQNIAYDMAFEIDDAVLEIQQLRFDVQTDEEMLDVPKFLYILDQDASLGQTLQFNLRSFFNTSMQQIQFSHLTQEDSLNVTIRNGIAFVQPLSVGTFPIYFRATVNNVPFISRLVKIRVSPADGNTKALVIEGNANPFRSPSQKKEFNFQWIFLALGIVVLTLFGIIPSRFYSFDRVAQRLDSMRKSSTFVHTFQELEAAKLRLGSKGILSSEKEKILQSMEEKVHDTSSHLLKNQLLDKFGKLEKQFMRHKLQREETYKEMDTLYRKLLQFPIPKKEKELLYKRIRICYNML